MSIRSIARSRRNFLRGLAVTAALAPALALAVSGTAHASTPAPLINRTSATVARTPPCPAANLCTFQNSGYGGTQWNFGFNNRPHLAWFYIGDNANDHISSMYNNRAWFSYIAKNCPINGNVYGLNGGDEITNLASDFWPDNSPVNDSISALAFGTSTSEQSLSKGAC